MVIKLNKNNKAYTEEGLEVTNFDKAEPSKFMFRLQDGSVLEIPIEKCTKISGGYYKADYDGVEYIFDDDNRFESILLGYLVYKNYDIEIIEDKEFGVNLRNKLYDEICTKCQLYSNAKEINKDGIDYIVCIDKINTIVSKNQQRKDEGKKVFPFMKTMDKFGTFYLSIFTKSHDEIIAKLDAASIIQDILDSLNDDINKVDWKFIAKEHNRIPLYI